MIIRKYAYGDEKLMIQQNSNEFDIASLPLPCPLSAGRG
jgi:hypothetical protein